PAHVLRPDAGLRDVADAFARDARSLTAYVTTGGDRLAGAVPFQALRRAVHPRRGARFPGLAGLLQRAWSLPVTHARDLARDVPAATLETRIRDALFTMDLHRLADLPVVDRRGRLVLELTHGAHARLLSELMAREKAPARAPARAADAPSGTR
ncbi:MAG TPA: CBS domain-containing protein, partial [Candidatus Thermoplasmatota archaeon]|nr:CBS domain-containing protein [Candidatus Thermoplasmatota archaeon]